MMKSSTDPATKANHTHQNDYSYRFLVLSYLTSHLHLLLTDIVCGLMNWRITDYGSKQGQLQNNTSESNGNHVCWKV